MSEALRTPELIRAVCMLAVALTLCLGAGTAAPQVLAQAQEQGQDRGRSEAAPIDDATLKREYDDYRASLQGMNRYGVHYILVATETEARQLIARVRSGGNFAEQARRHSLHRESAPKGGDLGTHASCRWARDTVAMLDGLKPGQVHPQPVKGSNGWGVYRLDSKEAVVPRSFTQYREELLGGRFVPECPWQPPLSVGAVPAAK